MKMIIVGLAALAVATAVRAAPQNGLQPGDLFALQYAADPQIRTDGRQIAYVRIGYDRMTDRARRLIWLIDPVSGEQQPLIAGGSPRWSPTGDRLAFIAADETGHPQLWVRWLASGGQAKLADLPSAPGGPSRYRSSPNSTTARTEKAISSLAMNRSSWLPQTAARRAS